MDPGTIHVVAASLALALGLVVMARRKGDAGHVRLGRLYVAAVLAVDVPVLFVYDITGGPGPFHVLAVVSLVTTALGWLRIRRRARSRPVVVAHATFMAWSWIGLVTAGLAQLANHAWPDHSPWPVLVVVGVATLTGAMAVPPRVARGRAETDHHEARRSEEDGFGHPAEPRPPAAAESDREQQGGIAPDRVPEPTDDAPMPRRWFVAVPRSLAHVHVRNSGARTKE